MPLGELRQSKIEREVRQIPRRNLFYAAFAPHIPVKSYGDIMLKTEEYLIETADRCIRLAREGRELVSRLEAISNELMAKAVELDTARQKTKKPSVGAGEASAS
jgi:hypothetical protein